MYLQKKQSYIHSHHIIVWYGITAAVILSVVVIWYLLIYHPLHEQITQEYAAVHRFYTEQELQNKTQVLRRKKEAEIQSLRTNLAQYQATSADHIALQNMLDMICGYAHTAGVMLHSCVVDVAKHKEWCTIPTYRFRLKASLPQLHAWFESIKTSKKAFTCAALDMARQQDANYEVTATIKAVLINPKIVT